MESSASAVLIAKQLSEEQGNLERFKAVKQLFQAKLKNIDELLASSEKCLREAEAEAAAAGEQKRAHSEAFGPDPPPEALDYAVPYELPQPKRQKKTEQKTLDPAEVNLLGTPETLKEAWRDLEFLRRTRKWMAQLAIIAVILQKAGEEVVEAFFTCVKLDLHFPWRIPKTFAPFQARPMATGFRQPLGIAKPKEGPKEEPKEEPKQEPKEEPKQEPKDTPRSPFILPATDPKAIELTVEQARVALCMCAEDKADALMREIQANLASDTALAKLIHDRVDKLWVEAAKGIQTKLPIKVLEKYSHHFHPFTWRLAGVYKADSVKTDIYKILIKKAIEITLSNEDLAALLAC